MEERQLSLLPARETAVERVDLTHDELETLYVGLVRTYHGAVIGYICSLVPVIQQAEDLAQDTFVRAYLALPRIGPPENPRAWLFRIATNVTIDYLRKRRPRRLVALHRLAHRLRGADTSAAIESADPVNCALAELKPKDQTILMLFAHVGLKAPEVAEVLGISPAAARKRRQRAREAFTRAYREQAE